MSIFSYEWERETVRGKGNDNTSMILCKLYTDKHRNIHQILSIKMRKALYYNYWMCHRFFHNTIVSLRFFSWVTLRSIEGVIRGLVTEKNWFVFILTGSESPKNPESLNWKW